MSEKYEFSHGFQESVISLLLQDPMFIVTYSDTVRPEYFEDERHEVLARIALEFYAQHRVRPGLESIGLLLSERAEKYQLSEDELSALKALTRKCYSADIDDSAFIQDRVIKFGRWQALKSAVIRAADRINENDRAEGAQEDILHMVQEAIAVGIGLDDGLQVFDHIDKPSTVIESDPAYNVTSKVATGFTALDTALRGGVGAGELAVVAGESGRGKSMFLVSLAAQAVRQGKRVLYVSTELRPPDIFVRVLCNLSALAVDDVLGETKAYRDRIARWKKIGSRYLRIKWWPPGRATAGTIRSYIAKRMQQENGQAPQLLVVDYADELKPERPSKDSLYLDFEDVYNGLIQLASDFKFPLWTASQVNRTGYGQSKPDRQSVSDSLKKLMKSDVWVMLAQTEDERQLKPPTARLEIDKVRRGKSGFSIRVDPDYERSRVMQVPPADCERIEKQLEALRQSQRTKRRAGSMSASEIG